MKCSNIHCPHGHYSETAKQPCNDCKRREKTFWDWVDNLVTDKDSQQGRRKREQDNRHKKGDEE